MGRATGGTLLWYFYAIQACDSFARAMRLGIRCVSLFRRTTSPFIPCLHRAMCQLSSLSRRMRRRHGLPTAQSPWVFLLLTHTSCERRRRLSCLQSTVCCASCTSNLRPHRWTNSETYTASATHNMHLVRYAHVTGCPMGLDGLALLQTDNVCM